MNTYYEILEVDNNVSREEVKKAYFKIIRKYPLEHKRQRGRQIRMVYEVLSNDRTRAEYDNLDNMPQEVNVKFNHVSELINGGRFKNAIIKLKELSETYPEIMVIKTLLGIAYLQNRNTGSATTVFEELVSMDNNNSSFSGNLAYSYLLRGWQKKAIKQYKKAISLDKDNIFLVIGLSEAYLKDGNRNKAKAILKDLLKREEVRGISEFLLEIDIRLLILDIKNGDVEYIGKVLDEIEVCVKSNDNLKDNIGDMLLKLAEDIFYIDLDMAKLIINKAFSINSSEEIEEYRNYVNRIEALQREMAGLTECGEFDSLLLEVIDSKLYKEEFDGKEIPFAPEELFLKNIDEDIKEQISLISKNAPKIYEELRDYFRKILDDNERDEIIKRIEISVRDYNDSINGEFFKIDASEMEAVMKELNLFG